MPADYQPDRYAKELEGPSGETAVFEAITNDGLTFKVIADDQGRNYLPTTNSDSTLMVILQGQLIVWVNRDHYNCQAGTRLVIPANNLYWMQTGADGCRYLVGHIN